MSESGIQHKQTFTAQPGFGFDDAGERVPTVSPHDSTDPDEISDQDAARIRQETILRFVSWLLEARDAEAIGRKLLITAYELKQPDGPRTLEELGARFSSGKHVGVGKARVSQILSALNREKGKIASLFG